MTLSLLFGGSSMYRLVHADLDVGCLAGDSLVFTGFDSLAEAERAGDAGYIALLEWLGSRSGSEWRRGNGAACSHRRGRHVGMDWPEWRGARAHHPTRRRGGLRCRVATATLTRQRAMSTSRSGTRFIAMGFSPLTSLCSRANAHSSVTLGWRVLVESCTSWYHSSTIRLSGSTSKPQESECE